MQKPTLLEQAHQRLRWPSPQQILSPTGAGPRVYANLAEEKIGKTIRRLPDGEGVRVGVLTPNPGGNATETPLAVVCEFPRIVSESTLKETHRLAWSFSRAPSLITLEPHLLRAWTCYEVPEDSNTFKPVVEQVPGSALGVLDQPTLSQQAAEALHWVELVSGHFFQKHNKRFQKENAGDQLLFRNLRSVRRELRAQGLDFDIIHELLARIIFIQFLFHRKDSAGNTAIDATLLSELHSKGVLSTNYRSLSEILSNYQDTYEFFRWLNSRFNGDLFPGKGNTEEECEASWRNEMEQVKPQDLGKLAQFVSGELRMDDGQLSLWPQYHFDAIPLEFISSIYEEFVRKDNEDTDKGVHYTPAHIVDLILDNVLPWNSTKWDIKILDPACGSGIFLVKAFQRLIHRWKRAHKHRGPLETSVLSNLLKKNLFGVDVNPHAIRVASFSLYLTMCDEIDPRRYWEEAHFPILRHRQLIDKDFFREDIRGFRTKEDSASYDLVVGNAPWGKDTINDSEYALSWAKDYEWPVTNEDIGPLFLPKAAALTKPNGRVAMLQPAGALLTNRIPTAKRLRKKIFSEFSVEQVINLSALRFGLFREAIAPSCVVTLQPKPSRNRPLVYVCPKPTRTNEDNFHLVIEPQDINLIYQHEAAEDPTVWTGLMWGSRRDLVFIRRLGEQHNLGALKEQGVLKRRKGLVRGEQHQKVVEEIVGRRMLEGKNFPEGTFLRLDARSLPKNLDPKVHDADSTDLEPFELPQLILKKSWQKKSGRFKAVITEGDSDTKGVVCSQSYVSIHLPIHLKDLIEAACLSYNSKLAVYYLLLTSGRFSSYRPESLVEEVLTVPVPRPVPGMLQNVNNYGDVDLKIREAFNFKDSEWALIDDLFNYTLPDFKGGNSSPGRQKTGIRVNEQAEQYSEPILQSYCECFIRVMKAGFGYEKQIGATIFREKNTSTLPLRLVAFYLNREPEVNVQVEHIDSDDLLNRLVELNDNWLKNKNTDRGDVFYQRVARLYASTNFNGHRVPTIYLIKPDQRRYWTCSTALRDADEVAADLMLWRAEVRTESDLVQELGHG